jgi:hypothetical protein
MFGGPARNEFLSMRGLKMRLRLANKVNKLWSNIWAMQNGDCGGLIKQNWMGWLTSDGILDSDRIQMVAGTG